MNGLLVIDKPAGITSRDVVNVVQKWFPRKTKLGHTGTLDPLATGVLVVCVGAATRLADFVQAMGKSYTSRIRLGATSTTDDADGIMTANTEAVPPTREQVDAALAAFVGTIEQFPPTVSALMVGGHRAHDLARAGKDVPLAARTVHIEAIRVVDYAWPFLDVEVDCGKGTYIRSIARDLGAKLGVGGLVETLRRTRIGPFTADQGIGLETIPAEVHLTGPAGRRSHQVELHVVGQASRLTGPAGRRSHQEEVQEKLLPMAVVVAGMPAFRIDAETERRFRTGQCVPIPGGGEPPEGSEAAIFDDRGELIAIAVIQRGLQPKIVLGRSRASS